MGLKWRHYSRHYIIAWENGPYVVMEKHWWKHKRIAQFDYSLQMAVWYVQEMEPNASVSIVWMPRQSQGMRPNPLPPTAAAHEKQAYHLIANRGVSVVERHDLPHPSGGCNGTTPRPTTYGALRPGDTVIALAKPPKPKYVLRRMNTHGVMEDVS